MPSSLAVLRYVRRFTAHRGFPPTLREIAGAFGMRSHNGAKYHLRKLERDGLLERGEHRARALRPVEREEEHDGAA